MTSLFGIQAGRILAGYFFLIRACKVSAPLFAPAMSLAPLNCEWRAGRRFFHLKCAGLRGVMYPLAPKKWPLASGADKQAMAIKTLAQLRNPVGPSDLVGPLEHCQLESCTPH